MSQVVTIHADGKISGLQPKPGKGFDLRTLGKAKIERASEILFSEEHQQWYVKIVKGRYAGKVITHPMLSVLDGRLHRFSASDLTAYFAEYDDAVLAEIAVLDHIRLTEGPDALDWITKKDPSDLLPSEGPRFVAYHRPRPTERKAINTLTKG